MTSLILGSLRRERSSTLRALRPCCINDLWLRLDCRICWPRKRSETTTATLLASDARSARLMDDMRILALAPRTGIRNQLLDDLPQHLTRTRSATAGEGEHGLQWKCFHKGERGITAASGWLHRLVRSQMIE